MSRTLLPLLAVIPCLLALPGCKQAAAPAAAPTAPAAAAAPAPAQPAEPEPAAKATTGHPNLPGFVRPSAPVATVNSKAIAATRFNGEFDRLVGTGARIPADRIKHIARNILARLIEKELRHQAIVRENITLTEPEFEAAYAEYTARFTDADGRFDEAQFEANLQRSRMTPAELKAEIREQRLARKLVDKIGRVEVSDEEARNFYDNNPSSWMEAESRDVRPIKIRVGPEAPAKEKAEAERKANEAYQALTQGGDFEQIASRFGEEPLAPIRLTRNAAEQELARAAFELKVGEVSKPIKTRWGWYVLRLIEKNPQRVRAYDEVATEIKKTLRARKFYLEDRRIVQELRQQAEIVEKLPF